MKNNDVKNVIRFMTGFIEEVSHELVNKVATLQMKQQGLEKVFPVLMQGYNLAIQNNLLTEQLSKRIIDGVGDLINLNEQLSPMLEVLDKINHYMETISNPQTEQEYSIRQCVQQVLEQDIFNTSEQRRKIQIEADNDFFTHCPTLFVETAVYHLLHNLLDIKLAKSVMIRLLEEPNILTITGHQIVAQQNPRNIFDHYLYKHYDKSHPSLSFCRQAMNLFGGDIIVKNENELIVEYQLVFESYY